MDMLMITCCSRRALRCGYLSCQCLLLFILLLSVSKLSWGKEIALSFDDAPRADTHCFTGPERTVQLLAQLQRAAVPKALFLVTTQQIDAMGQARLRAYAAAGHSLGNHSHQHRHPADLGLDAYLADVAIAEQFIKALPGRVPMYRFPFLDEGRDMVMRDGLRAGLQALGLQNAYVTVDNYDWYMDHLLHRALAAGREVDFKRLGVLYVAQMMDSIRFYDGIARQHLGRSPRHILLLHENDLAALYIGDLVQQLRAEGWQIITPERAYEDPIARSIPDTLFNGQGRVAALAHVQGVKARELVPDNEDEAYLERLFEQSGVYGPAAQEATAAAVDDLESGLRSVSVCD